MQFDQDLDEEEQAAIMAQSETAVGDSYSIPQAPLALPPQGQPSQSEADLVRQFILDQQQKREYDAKRLRGAQRVSSDMLLNANLGSAGADIGYAIAGVKNPNPGAFDGLKKQAEAPIENFAQGRKLETEDATLSNQAQRAVMNYIGRAEAVKARQAASNAAAKRAEDSFGETKRHNRAIEGLSGGRADDAKTAKFDAAAAKKAESVREIEERARNIEENIALVDKMIEKEGGTYEMFGSHNQDLDRRIDQIATDMAKLQDPNSVARPGEVELVKQGLVKSGFKNTNKTAREILKSFGKEVQARRSQAYKVRGLDLPVAPEKDRAPQTDRVVIKKQKNPKFPGKVKVFYEDGGSDVIDE